MSLQALLVTTAIFQWHHLNAQELGHLRANHGEHCNETVRCDTSAFLTCVGSVCECQQRNTMFYDPIIKSCLILVGEKCRYKLVKSKDDFGEIHDSRHQLLEDELDCVQNAWCNRSGVCMCAISYLEIRNGTCISRRNLGESCTSDRECRQDQYLICVNGHCGCNETVATYNILIRQCVGKAGKPCVGSSAGCVYNAECMDKSTFSLGFTKRRMRQATQICGCNPGFVADSSGFCRVGLGGHCSKTKRCADGFKCKNNQCVCQFENIQLALLRSQTCLSLVGGPCNETIFPNESSPHTNYTWSDPSTYQQQTFQCIDNAYCALTNNGSVYECQCNDGFVVSYDGTCDLAFGSVCNDSPFLSLDTDSGETNVGSGTSSKGVSCDRATPLFCIDGVCQCESSLYEYSMEHGICMGRFGARCEVGMTRTLTLSTSNVTLNGCIPNAECVSSRDARSPHGKCICSTGFIVASNRSCIPS